MNCREMEARLTAYVDDELDLVHNLEVERHLSECGTCAAAWERQRAVKRAVAEHAPYYAAPAELRRRVGFDSRERSKPSSWQSGRWLALAAACLAAMAVIWRVAPYPLPPASEGIESQVVAGHVRSLLADHLMDVPSSDHHTVKPWFTGRLDFAPDVPDLSAKGFTLTGGRLDYLNGRTVAALVYRRRQHTINLFTWPAQGGDQPVQRSTRDGFHMVHWRRGGIEWWAVSDLNADELAAMAALTEPRP